MSGYPLSTSPRQSVENRVIIACAGAGKTTRLVRRALSASGRRIAMVTYTNNNARAIVRKFGEENSGIPGHVRVLTWFAFLLRECARPYQRALYPHGRIDGISFVNKRSTWYESASDIERYYFGESGRIYSDKIARFVVECNSASGGAVVRRLARVFTDIFIDEFQDLAGWDYEIVEMLLRCGIRVTMVGDPRQHIYSTNPAKKNQQYLGANVVRLIRKWERLGLCTVEMMNQTHRCGPEICEFVNRLWPEMEEMTSAKDGSSDHEGVFLVSKLLAGRYIERYRPQVLRHDRRAETFGCEALNFGAAKGLEFDRVLIIPTGPISKFLRTGELDHVARSRDRLHVAVTRARHSVAFVYDGPSPIVHERWYGLD